MHNPHEPEHLTPHRAQPPLQEHRNSNDEEHGEPNGMWVALGQFGSMQLRSRKRWRAISTSGISSSLACLDVLSILLAGIAALMAYADLSYIAASWRHYSLYTLAGALGAMILAWFVGSYDDEVFNTPFLRPWRAMAAWTATLLALLGAVFFFQDASTLSRAWVTLWFVFGGAGLSVVRILVRAKIAWWRSKGWMRQRVVIVGTPKASERLQARLQKTALRDLYQVVGVYDDGAIAAVVASVREAAVEAVMICPTPSASEMASELSAQLRELPVRVLFCPDFGAVAPPVIRTQLIGDLSLLEVSRPPLSDSARIVKGLEDRIIAGAMLLILAPLMLAIAAAIKLDSRGPVLFKQLRFGFNNRPISVFKFRSMRVELGDSTGAQRTVRGDARVTRVGRFIRTTSFDELPQLFNVLRGEMSLVGPRAHPIMMKVTDRYYHEVVHGYAARHRVKPGITGLAQINGCRGEVETMDQALERVRYDLDYAARWSLGLDLKIMLLTPMRGLRKAY